MTRDILDQEDRRFAAALRPLTAEARRALGSHPSSDELVAYHRNDLSEGEEETVRDHLALCPDCARRGLDLAAFVEPESSLGAESAPAADAIHEEWRALGERLRKESLEESPGTRGPLPAVVRLFGSPRFAYALAALFLVAALLPWLGPGRGPDTSWRVRDLYPDERAQRDGIISAEPLAAGYDYLLVLDSPGELPDQASYRAEIFPLGGAHGAAKRIGGLEPDPDGFFTIPIPDRSLAAGSYGVRIYMDQGTDDDIVLAEYRFQVEEP